MTVEDLYKCLDDDTIIVFEFVSKENIVRCVMAYSCNHIPLPYLSKQIVKIKIDMSNVLLVAIDI